MPSLFVLTGSQKHTVIPLEGDRIVLGRDGRFGIAITDAMLSGEAAARQTNSISRRHAVLTRSGGRFFIEDGDGHGKPSHNRTYVNDRVVPFPERRPLAHGDRIRICDFACVFQEDDGDSTSIETSVRHDSAGLLLKSQTADRLRILLEISNSLSTGLDIDALLLQIVRRLLRLFGQADRGFFLLRDEATGRLAARVLEGRLSGEPPDTRFSASIVSRCLDRVEGVLGNDLAEQFPNSESVAGLPVRSLMCAPLWSQSGDALGAIQLDTQDPKKKFTDDDLEFLMVVAGQASVALCNARLYRDALAYQRRAHDLETARQVQRALLPQRLPDLPGYDFYAHYDSALEVGGDYYDFVPLPGGRLGVLLGDVAGKGVTAALIMVKFSVEARGCLLTEADPEVAVGRLNAVMTRAALADRFVTLAAVVLDPATHTATLVNAGHPSPLLTRHATGAVEEATPLAVRGTPLGLFDGGSWGSCRVSLEPGDGLLLFSDGVTEAQNAQGQPFLTRRVRSVLDGGPTAPCDAGDRLVRAVARHASGCPRHDDITVVCLRRSPPAG